MAGRAGPEERSKPVTTATLEDLLAADDPVGCDRQTYQRTAQEIEEYLRQFLNDPGV